MSAPIQFLLAAFVIGGLLAVPLFVTSPYYMSIAVNACTFTVLAIGLNLVYGYVGLLSLCQVAFWGLYFPHSKTRNFWWEMMRKLSET